MHTDACSEHISNRWSSEKAFSLKAFTCYFWAEEGHIGSVLLTVISPNRSWLSHQVRWNTCMQLFCDRDYYPVGPSRDWTAIAKFYCRQNGELAQKGFIWPHRPPSGFCPKTKISVFVASLFPVVCQSFTDDQNQRVSFVCCANSWTCIWVMQMQMCPHNQSGFWSRSVISTVERRRLRMSLDISNI